MIIQPAISAWYGGWKGMINIILFYGYLRYPLHIAFKISAENSTKNDRIIYLKDKEAEMII
jgi:hypothetical protein